jgi:hypothetical protein
MTPTPSLKLKKPARTPDKAQGNGNGEVNLNPTPRRVLLPIRGQRRGLLFGEEE